VYSICSVSIILSNPCINGNCFVKKFLKLWVEVSLSSFIQHQSWNVCFTSVSCAAKILNNVALTTNLMSVMAFRLLAIQPSVFIYFKIVHLQKCVLLAKVNDLYNNNQTWCSFMSTLATCHAYFCPIEKCGSCHLIGTYVTWATLQSEEL
jgi:hypothetical protein